MRCCLCKSGKMNVAIYSAVIVPILAYGASNQNQGEISGATQEQMEPEQEKKPVTNYVLDYEMETIEGKPIELESFKGKVVLMVNVASKCGLTPQYEGLEALYKKHKKDGLVVIGFPANNFAGQEPGTDAQIAEFCTSNYGVTFPMMSKISVKGKDAHPLYKQLAAQPEPIGGEPGWNFDKFLINHNGEVVARHGPRVTPKDPKLVEDIERLLEDAS